MKITKVVLIFIIAIIVDLIFLIISITMDPQFDEREGMRPTEGISIGHDKIWI